MKPRIFLFCAALLLPNIVMAEVAKADTIDTKHGSVSVSTITDGLVHPWGMAFLPDGRMLVTERIGNMRIITPAGDKSPPLKGLPNIEVTGQGGLLDVIVAPDFEKTKQLYFSYTEPGDDGNSTAVAKAKLGETGLTDVEVIFSQQPKHDSRFHFGSRLVLTPQGRLFITLGDRNSRRDDAQTLDNHQGKVVRINTDGTIPADNPYVGQDKVRTDIWSYGHRNIQGADLHPQTGELWTHEHGPQGGDEINITRAGKNYGWPIITYGEEYGGGHIGQKDHAGMEQPLHYWVPSIAPSGMIFYTGSLFKEWQNQLLVGSLKFGQLVRLQLKDDDVIDEERLVIGPRIRDVTQGPDGAIYLLTDAADGAVLRLAPVK